MEPSSALSDKGEELVKYFHMSVPIGYLIPALFVLLSVYSVITPMTWPRPFRFWWLVTAVVNEIPLFGLLFLGASTVLTISEGDMHSFGSWVAFGCNVAAAVGLLVLFLLSSKTAAAIKLALQESFGHTWTDDIDHRLVRHLDKGFSAKALLGPFFKRSGDVRHIRTISYSGASKYQSLDVYHKKSIPESGAVFIHLHGGALRSGKKDHDALPLLYSLANRGWVCISANYRLQPYIRFNEQLEDIRQIVAWARTHAAEYSGDPNFVVLSGGSSGGQLAAMIGLEPGLVDAVVALYGNFYFGSSDESPIMHINKAAPPFFILHGDHDGLIPVEGARRFAKQLRSVSDSPVVYAELPNTEHNFDLFNSVRSEAIASAVEAFGAVVRKSKHGKVR